MVKLRKMSRTPFVYYGANCALMWGLLFPQITQAENYLSRDQGILRSTYLVEVKQNTDLSLMASAMQQGGYETSRGEWQSFEPWYKSTWKDTRLSWLTQITPQWGLIWGLSTGERGMKYRIAPGLRLGFVFQTEQSKYRQISFSFSGTLGGRLREKPCIADYGDIAGVQLVNCRLAASALEPSSTLQYLAVAKPETIGHLQYRFVFD
jgi:hypothetical protein